MSSIGNIFLQNNPYEPFVQQLVQIESRTKLLLQSQKSTQNEKKTALGEVSASISKFVSKIEELQDPKNKAFQPLSGSSSNKDIVSVTSTDGMKNPGNYDITVNRVASNDLMVSQVLDGTGSTLHALGDGSVEITIGDKTELITVETTYLDEAGVVQQKTNDEILKSFSDKINAAFGDRARSNRFNTSGDNVQFSIQSLETGFDNRIQLSGATGFLADLTTNMTRTTPVEQLNATFAIDGVTFERSQNSVDDAIEGLTFQLIKADAESATMSINRDTNKAKANINGFISAYNNLNKTIRDRTFLDTDNDRRGALQDVRAVRNLTINLRQTGLSPITGVGDGEMARLSDMGISFKNDGTMFIDNDETLTNLLTEDPNAVTSFFNHENSVVSSMKNQSEAYVKSDTGILTSIESGFDQRIDRLDRRIESQNRYLERYEEEQRNIFNNLNQIITRGESQFAQVMSFRQRVGF